ncbi:MAG: hypothetical protein OXL96_00240 [Candidatus Poribacteria bacterium]|nr:hypothetical protein [Candidatus Poribacteria bacterium]
MTDVNDHVSVSVGRARHVADNPINVADDVNVSKESGAPPGNDSPPPLAPDSSLAIEQAQDIFMNNTDVTSTGTDTAVKTFFSS